MLAGLAPAWRVVALATGSQSSLLEAQARQFRPAAVALGDETSLDLPAGTRRVRGADALVELATRDDVDLVVVATGGVVSLRPVLAALRAGKVVATANKETLVAGRPPRDGRGPCPRRGACRSRPARTRSPARSAGSARSIRSTPRSGSASSAKRCRESPGSS